MQSLLWRNGDVYKRKLTENNPSNSIDVHSSINSSSMQQQLHQQQHAQQQQYIQKSDLLNKVSTSPSPSLDSASNVGTDNLSYTNSSNNSSTNNGSNHGSSSSYSSIASTSISSKLPHTSSKERMKADMRMITATLKSIRTSSSITQNYMLSSPPNPTPPPSLYTTSTTPAYGSASPYSSSNNPLISTSTSSYTLQLSRMTKTTAPSGLALQQKKFENQQLRRNAFAGSSSPNSTNTHNAAGLKQSAPLYSSSR
jgi:hypothetical protein